MRKLLSVILITLLILNGNAWAQSWQQANPYKNTSSKENVASGSVVSSASGTPGTGYKLGPGDNYFYILDYGGQTAGSTLSGSVTPSGTRYILPACSNALLGYQFSLSTAVLETITITPYSTADSISYTISGSALTGGQGIKNTAAVGASVSVQCGGNAVWNVNNLTGSWSLSS